MSKLGLFLFVFALFACYISAYAVGPDAYVAGEPVRVEREASAQPDPGHRYHNKYHNNRGNGGYYYQHHYPQHHYPSNWNHGGWGGSRRG